MHVEWQTWVQADQRVCFNYCHCTAQPSEENFVGGAEKKAQAHC